MTGAALTEGTLMDPAHSYDQVDDHPDVPTHVSRDDAFTTLHQGDNRHGGVGIYAPINSSAPLYIGGVFTDRQSKEDAVEKEREECLRVLFETLQVDPSNPEQRGGDPSDVRSGIITEKGGRVDGTCEWITENRTYQSWLASRSTLLWVSGGPGKGKTMLAIFLSQELERLSKQSDQAVTIFFFCTTSEKRNSAPAILRGLVYQLLSKKDFLFRHISDKFRIQGRSIFSDSSFEALWSVFENMVRDPRLRKIYCIVDGLDECLEESVKLIIRKLRLGFGSTNPVKELGSLQVLIVSREHPECIISGLSGFDRIELDPDCDEEVLSDLKLYIHFRVKELALAQGYSDDLRDEVVLIMLEKAEGTFLWVSFVSHTLVDTPPARVLATLKAFPPGLRGMFSRMLTQISQSERDPSALLLSWVVMAFRPLSLRELAALTAVGRGPGQSWEAAMERQIASCGNILSVTQQQVRLVHASARDYLLRAGKDPDPVLERFRIKEGHAHAKLARICFEKIVSWYTLETDSDGLDFGKPTYACRWWPEHARSAYEAGIGVFDLQDPFYAKHSPLRDQWLRELLLETEQSHRSITGFPFPEFQHEPPHQPSALHTACYFGFVPWLEVLLKRIVGIITKFSRRVNSQDSSGRTPLFYAVWNGHKRVVKILIKKGANVNIVDSFGDNALTFAVRASQLSIAKTLLKEGVSPLASSTNPLLVLAAERGDDKMVSLLLRRSASGKGQISTKALTVAVRGGHELVVKILLDQGVSMVPSSDEPLLCLAVDNNKAAVVKLLAERATSTEINACGELGMSPLQIAAARSANGLVSLLLNTGKADVNLKAHESFLQKLDRSVMLRSGYVAVKGWTALHHAVVSLGASSETVNLLLNNGASVNATTAGGQTVLHLAGEYPRSAQVVSCLLRNNAKITFDSRGQTPLHVAAAHGFISMIDLLLSQPNSHIFHRDNNRQMAVHLAGRNLDRKVVKLLLKHYLDSPVHLAARTDDIEALKRTLPEPYVPGLPGRHGQTPLLDAALHGREAALQYLLDKGESACDRDYRGWSAVHMAASTGQVAVLEKLLKKTNDVPDVNGVDYWRRTPLHVAAEHRQLNVVKLLLDFKAHVDAETFFSCTALHYACERNHPDMIRVLLDRGAAVNAFERRTGSNALHLCADHGALEAAEVLLDQGIALDTKDLHWGDTAFMRACQNGHRTICELLLNRGAKPDVTGLDQRTPLHWAAEFGHIDVLHFLLEHGGRNAKRELYNGFTPLHLAVQSGVNEVVEMLLQRISIDELESKDLSHMTPLALARNRNDAHMIQILETARATLDTGASSDLETSGTL